MKKINYTVERTLVIPEEDLPLLDLLIKERNWRISEKSIEREKRVRQYLNNLPTDHPLMTEEEIREEIKAYRNGQ